MSNILQILTLNGVGNDSICHKSIQNESLENMSNDPKIALLEIERENRLSKVISLYRSGLNQGRNSTRTTRRSIYSK